MLATLDSLLTRAAQCPSTLAIRHERRSSARAANISVSRTWAQDVASHDCRAYSRVSLSYRFKNIKQAMLALDREAKEKSDGKKKSAGKKRRRKG